MLFCSVSEPRLAAAPPWPLVAGALLAALPARVEKATVVTPVLYSPPPTANAPKLRAVLPLKVVLRMVPVAKVATPPPRPWATALPVAAVARLWPKELVKTVRVPTLGTHPPTSLEDA